MTTTIRATAAGSSDRTTPRVRTSNFVRPTKTPTRPSTPTPAIRASRRPRTPDDPGGEADRRRARRLVVHLYTAISDPQERLTEIPGDDGRVPSRNREAKRPIALIDAHAHGAPQRPRQRSDDRAVLHGDD